MWATSAPRLSRGVYLAGRAGSIVFLTLLVVVGVYGFLVTSGRVSSLTGSIDQNQEAALEALHAIDGLPASVSRAFAENSTVSEEAIEALPLPQQSRVRGVLNTYNERLRTAALQTTADTGSALVLVAATYLVGIPLFIGAVLLGGRKHMWRCRACGHMFDRI
jgi:hypothetical protein